MGSGGAKKTNQLLEEQQRSAQDFSSTMGGRGAEQYGQQEELRDYLLGEYKGLYSGGGAPEAAASSGGGRGGRKGKRGKKKNKVRDFWSNMMETGGYSEADKANILSHATGPISGLFEGLQRNISSAQAGRGLPSYSGGISRAARDQAYSTSEAAKGVSADLAGNIIANQSRGASQIQAMNKARQARAAAAGARGSADRRYNDQMQLQYLDRIGGLMPSDLPYADRQLAGIGAGSQAAGARRDETPMWQKAAGSLIPAAAGAAVGAFSGPRRNPQQTRVTRNVGDVFRN